MQLTDSNLIDGEDMGGDAGDNGEGSTEDKGSIEDGGHVGGRKDENSEDNEEALYDADSEEVEDINNINNVIVLPMLLAATHLATYPAAHLAA